MKRIVKLCVYVIALSVCAGAFGAPTTILPANRILLFDDYASPVWTHEGPLPTGLIRRPLRAGTNHFHNTGWVLLSCRTGLALGTGRVVAPVASTNLAANLQNTLGAQIESPVFQDGIGTIYFEAINNVETNEVTVEWATNMVSVVNGNDFYPINFTPTNNLQFNFIPLDVLPLNASSVDGFVRYRKVLNYRQPAKFRIRRSGSVYDDKTIDDALTVIDNVRASAPPSDVVVYKTECPFNPGYPSVNASITIGCFVSNVYTNVPTDTRTISVVYRWRYLDQIVGAWKTNQMERTNVGDGQGNGEKFEFTLPAQAQVGDLEYFFSGGFDGYRYQSIDYTGTGLYGYPYPTEWLSPRTLRGGASQPDGREFYARLRPYPSRYGQLFAVTNQFIAVTNALGVATNTPSAPVEMQLTGNNQWRAMVPVGTPGVTNLVWSFKGVNEYVPGATAFLTNVPFWAEQNQVVVGSVPYGGICVPTNESGRIEVAVTPPGYLMITFNTETLDYMVRRAAYQNFNAWTARPDVYSESSGQAAKQSFINTFEAWPVDNDVTYRESFLNYVTTTNSYSRDPFFTPNEWVAASAAYVVERGLEKTPPPGTTDFRNLGLRLKGGDAALGLGYVHTALSSLPDGLKTVSFQSRLGMPIDRYDIAYYQVGFTNFNYGINASIQANDMSPEEPSVSLIGYYQNPGDFYEFRVTQTPHAGGYATDKRFRLELFKWRNGTATRLANSTLDGYKLTTAAPFELRIYNTSGTQTAIRCKYGTGADQLSFTDGGTTGGEAYHRGTFGVLTGECKASFTGMKTMPTTSGAAAGTDVAVPFTAVTLPDWYLASGAWTFVVNSGLMRVVPAQNIGVYAQPTSYTAPVSPGSEAWELVQQFPVSSFNYSTNALAVNSWQSQFVMFQVMGGKSDVVVDDMQVSSWHGKSHGNGDINRNDWLGTESWVVSNTVGRAHVVELDLTRADPSQAQAVRSMLLLTGLGMMEYDYQVLIPPVKLTVQFAGEHTPDSWNDVSSLVVSNATGWSHNLAYLGTNAPGYFRLLNSRVGGYSSGVVQVNDVRVWDEPYVDSSSWRVYNAKITNTDTNRVALDGSKDCFLNNSTTAEADPVQNLVEPYLQTPLLPTGLGELSFYARAFSNNQASTVYVYASTNGWNASSNQWFEISRVENITNMLFQLYKFVPLDGRKYQTIKLGNKTGAGARRVCLEDIVASEPVFPGFDIVNVSLLGKGANGSLHPQPLDTDVEVGVQAMIANKKLAPSNIVMRVQYYVGTNTWGVGNWTPAQTFSKRLYQVDNTPVYRTAEGDGLPPQASGQVVQYQVYADFTGNGVPLVEQQETFDNPSWYFPVDLNARYQQSGWSPYYIVYDLPPHIAWINEVNAIEYMSDDQGFQINGFWDNRFIEIAVPAGVDLNGWSVDLVKGEYVTQSFTLSGMPAQVPAPNGNGYAFIVIGDGFGPPNGSPPLPKLDFGYPGLTYEMPSQEPGGVRLRRPMGMYEDCVAYDWMPDVLGPDYSGALWAANDPEGQFVYANIEIGYGALGLTGETNQYVWSFVDTAAVPVTPGNWTSETGPWTPGLPNIGQVLPLAPTPSVSSNVTITSLMNVSNGTQNNVRNTRYTLIVKKGASTNIVYQADDWYRVNTVSINQQDQNIGSPVQTYTLPLNDLQADATVDVQLFLREDLNSFSGNSTMLNWLSLYGEANVVDSPYNGQPLTMEELYWLDANPTVTNRLDCAVTEFVVTPSKDLQMTVKLALNGQKRTYLSGGAVFSLEAKNALSDASWTLYKQYSIDGSSFDTNSLCYKTYRDPFNPTTGFYWWTPGNIYFRWKISLPDPARYSFPLRSAAED